jgi:glycosyltransferase involved in cell wall biosynthesis
MTKPPLVSVVIPTHNRPDMLREAIASVRAQTFTDYEILVVCNGASQEDLLRYAAIRDVRIIVTARKGIGLALNIGIAAARGEWVAFLDDDDLWEPNNLGRQLQTAESEDADLVFCDFTSFGRGARLVDPIRPPAGFSIREAFLLANYGGGCSVTMVRRSALRAVGGFDERLVCPDWDLWMRLSWYFRIARTDALLVRYRHHEGNTSKRMCSTTFHLRTMAKAFMIMPKNLEHMKMIMLNRAMLLILIPIYAFLNKLSLGWLSYFKREVLKLRRTAGLSSGSAVAECAESPKFERLGI